MCLFSTLLQNTPPSWRTQQCFLLARIIGYFSETVLAGTYSCIYFQFPEIFIDFEQLFYFIFNLTL